jgi:hypothetical protein
MVDRKQRQGIQEEAKAQYSPQEHVPHPVTYFLLIVTTSYFSPYYHINQGINPSISSESSEAQQLATNT